MRSVSLATQTALTAAREKGLVPRQFFWITAPRFDNGTVESFGLWTGDDTVSIDVIDGTTGATVTRAYTGGVSLFIGSIPRVSDLTMQTVDVSFSQIADVCQEIARAHNLRLAKIEVHAGFLDTLTRVPVDKPGVEFVGQVDGSPIETPAAGADGSITLPVVSDAIAMLTRTNPRKRSLEGQKRRSGDELGLYSSTVGEWRIHWGEASPK